MHDNIAQGPQFFYNGNIFIVIGEKEISGKV